jgi:tetratricopeptide (TPR) repeat protein
MNKRVAQIALVILGLLVSCTMILSALPLQSALQLVPTSQPVIIPTQPPPPSPSPTSELTIPAPGTGVAAPTPADPVVQARIQELRAKLQQNPNDLQSLIDLGTLSINTGQWQAAMQYDSMALQINPKNPQVQSDLGWAYFNQGLLDQARQQLQQAVDADGSMLDARLRLGVVLYRSSPQDIPAALAQWEQVRQADPNGAFGRKAAAYITQASGK